MNARRACLRVIPSRTSPSVPPLSWPVARGQRRTNGTGTATPLLVAGDPEPAALEATTVHVSVRPSSPVWTVYVGALAPAIGVPSRLHW